MPSAFSHAIAALATGKVCLKAADTKTLLTGIICAALPDLDAIGYWIGIPYESVLGHRGITHSILFALLLSFIVMILLFRSEKWLTKSFAVKWIYLFLATASHPILDTFTNGGLGVALFAPFDNHRYFSSYRPVLVSPISISGFFSQWGLAVLKSEFKWIWVPSIMIIASISLLRKNNPESKK